MLTRRTLWKYYLSNGEIWRYHLEDGCSKSEALRLYPYSFYGLKVHFVVNIYDKQRDLLVCPKNPDAHHIGPQVDVKRVELMGDPQILKFRPSRKKCPYCGAELIDIKKVNVYA